MQTLHCCRGSIEHWWNAFWKAQIGTKKSKWWDPEVSERPREHRSKTRNEGSCWRGKRSCEMILQRISFWLFMQQGKSREANGFITFSLYIKSLVVPKTLKSLVCELLGTQVFKILFSFSSTKYTIQTSWYTWTKSRRTRRLSLYFQGVLCLLWNVKVDPRMFTGLLNTCKHECMMLTFNWTVEAAAVRFVRFRFGAYVGNWTGCFPVEYISTVEKLVKSCHVSPKVMWKSAEKSISSVLP